MQVGLGLLFAYSGGMKLFVSGLTAFLKDVENFHLVSPPLDLWVAFTLPWLELIVGFCLILDFQRRGAAMLATLMTLVFVVAIALSWGRGLDLHCGCFGKSTEAVRYPQKMLSLVIQLAACVAIGLMGSQGREQPKE